MNITIKSNRMWMITPLLIGEVLFVGILIYFLVDFEQVFKQMWVFVADICIIIILLCIILALKFYRGKIFKFYENKIEIYNKKKIIETIYTQDIEAMHHSSFNMRYFVSIFFGVFMRTEGGCWKLYLTLKDGEKKELAFLGKRDIVALKDLYGTLLIID